MARRSLPPLALALLALTQPALAQEPQSAAQNDYAAAFYADVHPQTALDMLQHTPGFTLVESGDARGLSGTAGNVLINGQRPTAKDDSFADVLSRITAAQVERIEIIRGANLAEARGHSIVANVITRPGVNAGSYAVDLRYDPYAQDVSPTLEFSQSGWLGAWTWSRGLNLHSMHDEMRGAIQRSDENGAVEEDVRDLFDYREDAAAITAAASGPFGDGALSLNGRLAFERDDDNHDEYDAASGDDLRFNTSISEAWNTELGADWTRALNETWSFKGVGLLRYGDNTLSDTLSEASDSVSYQQDDKTLEAVGGATITGVQSWEPEFGVELAYNRLQTEAALSQNGAPIDLPGANTEVAESRAELYGGFTAPLGDDWRLTTRVAYEASQIEVTGDNQARQSLSYWKPSFRFVRSLGERTQLRIDLARSVSQLDFGAFAASVDVDQNRPLLGNAVLRPEVEDSLALAIDHGFGAEGALALTLTVGEVDGALAYLPVDGGGQALVNSTAVTYWSANLTATLPLDFIIPNAQLTLDGQTGEAERRDPVINAVRSANRTQRYLSAEFRHDLPELSTSYGVTYDFEARSRTWYASEIELYTDDPYWTAFVERSFASGYKATLTLSGLVRDRETTLRTFYDPDRTGAFAGSEYREAEYDYNIALRVARSFP